MSTDEKILDVLQKTLTKLDEMSTKLDELEKSKDTMDHFQMNMAVCMSELKSAIENDNIM